jgi:HAE1 family hydrophobic/amphiphilic exporter-1
MMLLLLVGLGRLCALLFEAASRLMRGILRPLLGAFDRFVTLLHASYAGASRRVLARPAITLLITVLVFAASLALYPLLGRELVPELVQGEFFVNAEMPPGTQLEVTDRRIAALERAARELPGLASVYAIVGSSSEQGGVAGEKRENIAQLTLTVEPPTSETIEQSLMETIRRSIESQNAAFAAGALGERGGEGPSQLGGGTLAPGDLVHRFGRPTYFSFRTPIEVELRGYNLLLLERLAADLVSRLRGIAGLVDVKSSTEGGNPELQIHLDRVRLAAYGYTVNDVAQLLRTKIQGSVATDITREDRTIDIRLRSEEQYRDSVRDLANLNIGRSGTTPIPLATIARIEETVGPAEIRRADGSRVASITANLEARDLGSVSREISTVLESMALPEGFDWRLGGQRQEMETSFASMRLAILLAVFMVYLVMASQFESLLHPLVILFSIPFSLIGVLLTLFLLNVTVSIVVAIGVILLAGIVVNNAIILGRLHQSAAHGRDEQDRRAAPGWPGAFAADPDDDLDDGAGVVADGARIGRGE